MSYNVDDAYYAVTVFFTHTDGHEAEAVALVAANDAGAAVDYAIAYAADLPHCVEILGGTCTEIDAAEAAEAIARALDRTDTRLEALTREETPNARETMAPTRATNITIH